MELTQKKSSNQTSFEFGDEKLKYSIKDSSGKRTFSTDYGSISDDGFDELEERNDWFRNVGVLWVLIGVFQIVSRLMESGSFSGSMWLTLGVICLVVYKFKTTNYTIVDAEKGRIFIIQDDQHSKILDEISIRRNKQWKHWYGSINYENDPQSELNKFQWLLDKNVISEDEFKSVKAEIGLEIESPKRVLN
ncbi:hypothetical protein JQC92_22140 [Shewanella sp. 202IG2-18]|uniref:hypothetical protein n=1 Tax=Parashewanella hymeniacidonis TaxID=2807618 RepID=UPI00195F3517|nr:hypothetical protein [Parashewanella hymeniacidonis]MBM7074676.1 hypothetical protein [Parashewanella hymeniacidonis]